MVEGTHGCDVHVFLLWLTLFSLYDFVIFDLI